MGAFAGPVKALDNYERTAKLLFRHKERYMAIAGEQEAGYSSERIDRGGKTRQCHKYIRVYRRRVARRAR